MTFYSPIRSGIDAQNIASNAESETIHSWRVELNRTTAPTLVNLAFVLEKMLTKAPPKNGSKSAKAPEHSHQHRIDRRNIMLDYLRDDFGSRYPELYFDEVIAEFRKEMLYPYRVGAALYVRQQLTLRTKDLSSRVSTKISRNYADKITALVVGEKDVAGAESEAKNLARERTNYASTTHYWAALFSMVKDPVRYYANPGNAFDVFLNGLGINDKSNPNRIDNSEGIARFFSFAEIFNEFNQERVAAPSAASEVEGPAPPSAYKNSQHLLAVPQLIDDALFSDAEMRLRTWTPPSTARK